MKQVAWDQKTQTPYVKDSTKTTESDRIVNIPDILKTILLDIKHCTKTKIASKNPYGIRTI